MSSSPKVGDSFYGRAVLQPLGPGLLGGLAVLDGRGPGGLPLVADVGVLTGVAGDAAAVALTRAAVDAGARPHAGLARPVHVEREGDRLGVIWEVAASTPLRSWVAAGADLGVLWKGLGPVLDALGAAHARGQAHGRLSADLLFTDGAACQLLGLGLGAALVGVPDGQPELGAPEGGPPTPASDVFRLALVLHELIGGVLPWAAGTDAARLASRKREGLRVLNVLPGPLRGPLQAALSADPAARPAMPAFRSSLQAAVWSLPNQRVGGELPRPEGQDIPAVAPASSARVPRVVAPSRPAASPKPPPPPAALPMAGRLRLVAATLAALLIGGGGWWTWVWLRLPAPPEVLDTALRALAGDLRRGWAPAPEGWAEACSAGYGLACAWPDVGVNEREGFLEVACGRRDPLACAGLAWQRAGRPWSPAKDPTPIELLWDRACRSRWPAGCVAGLRWRHESGRIVDPPDLQLEDWCADGSGPACGLLAEIRGEPPTWDGPCLPGDQEVCAARATWAASHPGPAGLTGDLVAGLEAACRSGWGAACVSLGEAFGTSLPADPGQAAAAFERACEAGAAPLCLRWGDLEASDGMGRNLAGAGRAAVLGCSLGYVPACDRAASLCGAEVPAACLAPLPPRGPA